MTKDVTLMVTTMRIIMTMNHDDGDDDGDDDDDDDDEGDAVDGSTAVVELESTRIPSSSSS